MVKYFPFQALEIQALDLCIFFLWISAFLPHQFVSTCWWELFSIRVLISLTDAILNPRLHLSTPIPSQDCLLPRLISVRFPLSLQSRKSLNHPKKVSTYYLALDFSFSSCKDKAQDLGFSFSFYQALQLLVAQSTDRSRWRGLYRQVRNFLLLNPLQSKIRQITLRNPSHCSRKITICIGFPIFWVC